MSTLLGVLMVLAQAANHDGTNGFDPASVSLVAGAGQVLVDHDGSREFVKWIHEDPGVRADVVKYFVACALDEKVVIRFEGWTWRGALGLAPNLRTRVAVLLPGVVTENSDALNEKSDPVQKNYPARRNPVRLALTKDDGRWVSSCLMAFANMKGSHQYVSIRGNPPAWKAPGEGPTASERWTMGYTEGVFFADLLNFNTNDQLEPITSKGGPPPPAALERSFTQSLDLPVDYPTPPTWWPPNVALGRTLDFDSQTMVHPKDLPPYRAARRLGRYDPHLHPNPPAAGSDPDYRVDELCTKPRDPPATPPGDHPEVVSCEQPKVERWRPLFVHLPWLVNLASLEVLNPSLPMQALRDGKFSETTVPCDSPKECVGPFSRASVNQPPGVVPGPALPARVIKLRDCQRIVAVLRLVEADRAAGLRVDPEENFTAIIRFRNKVSPKVVVEVIGETGTWQQVPGEWSASPDFQWLQVYPVRPRKDAAQSAGQTALKIRLTGCGQGEEATELNVAGFVPGKPWCSDRDDLLMQVCPAEAHVAGRPVVRRLDSR